MRAYFDALLRYFEFSGRTSRAQYWLFQLGCLITLAAAIAAEFYTTGRLPDREHPGFFVAFAVIFYTVPNITTTARRLHDIGRSGWWYVLYFVPLGGFVLLYWMCQRGDPGQNEFGDAVSGEFGPATGKAHVLPVGRAVRIGSGVSRPAAFDAGTISTQRFI